MPVLFLWNKINDYNNNNNNNNFVTFFMFITRYTSFILLYIFLTPCIFVLATKRNNYTDSEIYTSIVFHFAPVINSDVHAVRTRYLA